MRIPLHVWYMAISYSYFTVLPSTYFSNFHTIAKSKLFQCNHNNVGFLTAVMAIRENGSWKVALIYLSLAKELVHCDQG